MRRAHPEDSKAGRGAGRPGRQIENRTLVLVAIVVSVLVCAGTAYYVICGRGPGAGDPKPAPDVDPMLVPTAYINMETESGAIIMALYGNATPVTVTHFLELCRGGFYNDTIFHVAVKDQLVMGGGYLTNLSQKLIPIDPGTGKLPTIPLEINPVMKNTRGTIGMVHNATDPDSAVSEFYINLADNPSLDKDAPSPGFAVFGKVLSGMDYIDGIGNLTTSDQVTPGGVTLFHVPVQHVRILDIVVLY